MRHRKAGFKLGRTSAHREAMLRNMASSLFEHGQVTTTLQKAKALQPLVEKIITKAKRGDIHARRRVTTMLGGDRNAFAWSYLPKEPTEGEREQVERLRERASGYFPIPPSSSVERNRYGELRKAPKLVRHIFENVAPRFLDREGGYTRIIKLGVHRVGDAAELVLLQFVGNEEGPRVSAGTYSNRRRIADRRSAYAEKLRAAASVGAVATAPAPSDASPAAPDAASADDAAGPADTANA